MSQYRTFTQLIKVTLPRQKNIRDKIWLDGASADKYNGQNDHGGRMVCICVVCIYDWDEFLTYLWDIKFGLAKY